MDDLISRQALCKYALNQKDKSVTPNDIMRFPSAQPKRKMGHWLLNGERYGVQYYRCSECEEEEEGFNCAYMNYCPNCGARMEGEDDT